MQLSIKNLFLVFLLEKNIVKLGWTNYNSEPFHEILLLGFLFCILFPATFDTFEIYVKQSGEWVVNFQAQPQLEVADTYSLRIEANLRGWVPWWIGPGRRGLCLQLQTAKEVARARRGQSAWGRIGWVWGNLRKRIFFSMTGFF